MSENKSNFDKVSYNNAFNAQKYDRITIMLPKGKQPILKEHASARGESVNAFVNRAIDEALAREKAQNDN